MRLEEILLTISNEYSQLETATVKNNKATMNVVLKEIADHLSESSHLFKTFYNTTPTAPNYEYFQIKYPDYYNVDFCLKILCLELEFIMPGFVKVQIDDAYIESFKELKNICDKNGYINRFKFVIWFQQLISTFKSSQSVRINNKSSSVVVHVNETFYLDIKIGLICDHWPSFIYRYRPNITSKRTFHVIPVGPIQDVSYWRLNFNQQEAELLQNNVYLQASINLLKLLYSEDTKYNNVKVYWITTLALNLLENNPYFCRNCLQDTFQQMVIALKIHLTKKELPYYWNSKHNLLDPYEINDLKYYSNLLSKCITKLNTLEAGTIRKIFDNRYMDNSVIPQEEMTSGSEADTPIYSGYSNTQNARPIYQRDVDVYFNTISTQRDDNNLRPTPETTSKYLPPNSVSSKPSLGKIVRKVSKPAMAAKQDSASNLRPSLAPKQSISKLTRNPSKGIVKEDSATKIRPSLGSKQSELRLARNASKQSTVPREDSSTQADIDDKGKGKGIKWKRKSKDKSEKKKGKPANDNLPTKLPKNADDLDNNMDRNDNAPENKTKYFQQENDHLIPDSGTSPVPFGVQAQNANYDTPHTSGRNPSVGVDFNNTPNEKRYSVYQEKENMRPNSITPAIPYALQAQILNYDHQGQQTPHMSGRDRNRDRDRDRDIDTSSPAKENVASDDVQYAKHSADQDKETSPPPRNSTSGKGSPTRRKDSVPSDVVAGVQYPKHSTTKDSKTSIRSSRTHLAGASPTQRIDNIPAEVGSPQSAKYSSPKDRDSAIHSPVPHKKSPTPSTTLSDVESMQYAKYSTPQDKDSINRNVVSPPRIKKSPTRSEENISSAMGSVMYPKHSSSRDKVTSMRSSGSSKGSPLPRKESTLSDASRHSPPPDTEYYASSPSVSRRASSTHRKEKSPSDIGSVQFAKQVSPQDKENAIRSPTSRKGSPSLRSDNTTSDVGSAQFAKQSSPQDNQFAIRSPVTSKKGSPSQRSDNTTSDVGSMQFAKQAIPQDNQYPIRSPVTSRKGSPSQRSDNTTSDIGSVQFAKQSSPQDKEYAIRSPASRRGSPTPRKDSSPIEMGSAHYVSQSTPQERENSIRGTRSPLFRRKESPSQRKDSITSDIGGVQFAGQSSPQDKEIRSPRSPLLRRKGSPSQRKESIPSSGAESVQFANQSTPPSSRGSPSQRKETSSDIGSVQFARQSTPKEFSVRTSISKDTPTQGNETTSSDSVQYVRHSGHPDYKLISPEEFAAQLQSLKNASNSLQSQITSSDKTSKSTLRSKVPTNQSGYSDSDDFLSERIRDITNDIEKLQNAVTLQQENIDFVYDTVTHVTAPMRAKKIKTFHPPSSKQASAKSSQPNIRSKQIQLRNAAEHIGVTKGDLVTEIENVQNALFKFIQNADFIYDSLESSTQIKKAKNVNANAGLQQSPPSPADKMPKSSRTSSSRTPSPSKENFGTQAKKDGKQTKAKPIRKSKQSLNADLVSGKYENTGMQAATSDQPQTTESSASRTNDRSMVTDISYSSRTSSFVDQLSLVKQWKTGKTDEPNGGSSTTQNLNDEPVSPTTSQRRGEKVDGATDNNHKPIARTNTSHNLTAALRQSKSASELTDAKKKKSLQNPFSYFPPSSARKPPTSSSSSSTRGVETNIVIPVSSTSVSAHQPTKNRSEMSAQTTADLHALVAQAVNSQLPSSLTEGSHSSAPPSETHLSSKPVSSGNSSLRRDRWEKGMKESAAQSTLGSSYSSRNTEHRTSTRTSLVSSTKTQSNAGVGTSDFQSRPKIDFDTPTKGSDAANIYNPFALHNLSGSNPQEAQNFYDQNASVIKSLSAVVGILAVVLYYSYFLLTKRVC